MKLSHVRVAFVSYLLLHLLLALVVFNLDDKIDVSNFDVEIRFDYFFHIIAFLPWAFWGYFLRYKPIMWLSIGTVFAFCMEGLHYFIPYRTYNVIDFFSNFLGIFLGFLILHFFLFIKKRCQEKRP
ncbi:MAG: VanZ family protein [Bacteroidales bacterium]|nr:VanZ family protein [Bacteroidales bacterium]MDY0217469.1 VanZ family protein [Bacteroidales bacterium]